MQVFIKFLPYSFLDEGLYSVCMCVCMGPGCANGRQTVGWRPVGLRRQYLEDGQPPGESVSDSKGHPRLTCQRAMCVPVCPFVCLRGRSQEEGAGDFNLIQRITRKTEGSAGLQKQELMFV